MKLKLLFIEKGLTLFMFIFLTGNALFAQTIGVPTVNASGGPVTITFNVTNGLGSVNYFNGQTDFNVYLSDASGLNFTQIYTFNSSVFPASNNLASATITRTVPIPNGTTSGNGYRIAIGSTSPSSIGATGGNASLPFALSCSFVMPAQLNGAIKCSSPAITYYVLSITNTGSLTDRYSLSKVQINYPLGSSFLTLAGAPLSITPFMDPGETYTFMMLFETPNGTPPNNWNNTTVTGTSMNCSNVTQQTAIETFIYCGNNNSLPNAPDMQIVKTANTVLASVGEFIDYTITIKNNTTKNASNPVIKDFIPANVELISYNKAPGETRNVVFTYNAGTNTLNALAQTTMTSASLPLTIHIRVKTYCQSVPLVYNSAEVFTSSGDMNVNNDVSAATTSVNYSIESSQVGRWTGAFNNDWFDCRNWSGGVVPNNNIDAVIPNATIASNINLLSTKAPADKTARAHHITIDAGAALNMTNNGLFHVSGNWYSNGGFTANNGNVTFMGSEANSFQTIDDSTDKVTFNNLIINVSNGAKGLATGTEFGVIVNNNISLTSGDLRLTGKSQLVQTKVGATSNPSTGTGKVLVDQQGQSNMFSYNYWSSPVGTNNSYTVGLVLKDGTDPLNPQNVNWTTSYNSVATSPITLSAYWINKYQNQSGSYASWSTIGQNGTLAAGQGFTLKGSGASTPTQNYTFIGQPNDGHFTSVVSANNMNLCGNPYPSAIDAYDFIDDNAASITGTLYFWEQFQTNSSHVTANYEGGYATLTKTGATPPASPQGVSSSGSSTRVPSRYIPIGQGFLLFGSATGGTITFNNNQRDFVRESDEGGNAMFRVATAKSSLKKLRLGFSSPSGGIRRQILLGYMENNATIDFDNGYDALQIDTQETDIFFPQSDKKLVIQARGFFDTAEIVPIAVKAAQTGIVVFKIDEQENFGTQSIYLYDAVTALYHNLTQGSMTINLEPGLYNDRFSLSFNPPAAAVRTLGAKGLETIFNNGNIQIHNESGKLVDRVELFNLNGQLVSSYDVTSQSSQISLPVSGVATGTYIARVSQGEENTAVKILVP